MRCAAVVALPAAALSAAVLLVAEAGGMTVTTASDRSAGLPAAGPGATPQPPVADANSRATPQPPVAQASPGAVPRPPVADPTAVRIPTIGVSASPLTSLAVLDDGTLEVPRDPQRAGWWRSGPEPGETGAAVIVGHVDSRDGPGVFFRLRDLRAGDAIHVDRADGTTATFVVTRVEQHAKDAFPTRAVYGTVDAPALRLVTCGGQFDRGSGHYLDNVVVFARAA